MVSFRFAFYRRIFCNLPSQYMLARTVLYFTTFMENHICDHRPLDACVATKQLVAVTITRALLPPPSEAHQYQACPAWKSKRNVGCH